MACGFGNQKQSVIGENGRGSADNDTRNMKRMRTGGHAEKRKTHSGHGTPKAGTQLPGSGGIGGWSLHDGSKLYIPRIIRYPRFTFTDFTYDDTDLEIIDSPVKGSSKGPFAGTNVTDWDDSIFIPGKSTIKPSKPFEKWISNIVKYLNNNPEIKAKIIISTGASAATRTADKSRQYGQISIDRGFRILDKLTKKSGLKNSWQVDFDMNDNRHGINPETNKPYSKKVIIQIEK